MAFPEAPVCSYFLLVLLVSTVLLEILHHTPKTNLDFLTQTTCLLKPAFPFPWLFYFPTYFFTVFHPLLRASRHLKPGDVSQASSLSKGIPNFSYLSVQHMFPEPPVCNSTPCRPENRPQMRQPRLFFTPKIHTLRDI